MIARLGETLGQEPRLPDFDEVFYEIERQRAPLVHQDLQTMADLKELLLTLEPNSSKVVEVIFRTSTQARINATLLEEEGYFVRGVPDLKDSEKGEGYTLYVENKIVYSGEEE